jgi:hypothetical protein
LTLGNSANKGTVFLVIVTETRTHQIKVAAPSDATIANAHTLVAAGNAVLEANAREQGISASTGLGQPSFPTVDLSSQLTRLSELHASGALSASEFAAAKARLLSDS